MFIPSWPSSSATFFPTLLPLRVSLPRLPSSITIRTSTVSLCAYLGYSLKVKALAELVQANKEYTVSACAISSSSSSSLGDATVGSHRPRTFLNARNEQELLSGIKEEAEAGRLPPNVAAGMEELFHNYKNAVFQSKDPMAKETVLSNMTVALDRMFLDAVDPFVFPPLHKAIQEPFDYYMFGQNYIRPLIDFRNSYFGNVSLFTEIAKKLEQGHNVIFMSNHQTEADPAVISLLLETTNQYIAENVTYVAGDRVVTDPLCKPFSMGRNLICVYSKKHMFDVPELVEMKRKANTQSLKGMALLLRNGSQIIWIAPSGGRDRPDSESGEWCPATFDSSSVDNMRRLTEHSGRSGHIYPMAILCHDIMPPPTQVEKEIGEKRVISFHGVGVSVAPEIVFTDVTASCETPEHARNVYTQAIYNSVTEQYNVLKSAIYNAQGLKASTPSVTLSQPWS